MDEMIPLRRGQAHDPLARLVARASAFDVNYDVDAGASMHARLVAERVLSLVGSTIRVAGKAWRWAASTVAIVIVAVSPKTALATSTHGCAGAPDRVSLVEAPSTDMIEGCCARF